MMMEWNYDNVDGNNWNTRSLAEQSELLESFYPIGKIFIHNNESNTIKLIELKSKLVEIIGHIDSHINTKFIIKILIIKELESGKIFRMHPGYFYPDKSTNRNNIIKSIFNA